ncbi:MAG: glycosyltransferase [Acidobacteriota bacterium]
MSRFNPLDYPICFSHPLNVALEVDWIAHAPFGMVLVDLVRPRVIVEVGASDGVSYGVFCQAVRDLQLETRCFAINCPADEVESDTNEIDAFERLKNVHDELYGNFSRRIQSSPDEALGLFEDQTIDLLHIAANTPYPDAKRSFNAWLPKLSHGGVVLLSDTNVRNGEAGLWKLWTEIKGNYPHFEFVHERGLGVIAVGASPSNQLKQLLEAREPGVSLIREFFRQQGQKCKTRLEKDREIKALLRQIHDREEQIAQLSTKLESSQKNEGVLLRRLDKSGLKVEALSTNVEALSTELATTTTQLQAILNSRAWRWVSRYGRAKLRLLAPAHQLFPPSYENDAPAPVFQVPAPIDPFEAWLEVNRWNQRRESFLKQRLSELAKPPHLTVVMPVKHASVQFLNRAIESVVHQVYQKCELFIADDGNNQSSLDSVLKQFSRHRGIRVKRMTSSGNLSRAVNEAITSAGGEYVVFVGQADEVTPDALGELALYLRANPEVQVVYTDHDRIDPENVRCEPQPKPDWSPNGKQSQTSLAPFFAIKRSLAIESDALPADFQGSADSDFDLTARERNWHVGHVSKILYHQRCLEKLTRANPQVPNDDAMRANGEESCGKSESSGRGPLMSFAARTAAPLTLKPIRTLMCSFNLGLEGAPYSQYEMTVKLKENGVIDPIVYSPTDGPLRQEYEHKGIEVRVRPHPLAGATSSRDYESSIAGFAKWLTDRKVELVYGNTLQTFYAIEASHRLNLPSVWNPRESEPWRTYFDFLPTPIANRALQCFSYPYQVIFVAHATQEAWQILNSRHNFTVIHNGLNRERFNTALGRWPRAGARKHFGVSDSELLVLLLGTVCERKGQIDLVRAVRDLSDENAGKAKFLIVGDRPSDYSEQLRNELTRIPHSRRSRIDIIPETADAARFYAAADIFVCTSRIESFPRVILEALAAGLPIITTPVFGIAEQVRQDESALFYDPGDVSALAAAITRLIEEPALRRKLAAGATPALDALIDFDSMVNAYAEIFREAWLSGATRALNIESSSPDSIRGRSKARISG